MNHPNRTKYEMYEITARANQTFENYFNPEKWWDEVRFHVRATSHTQHIWNSTFLNGLSPEALQKINHFRAKGFTVTVLVGGRHGIVVEN